MGGTGRDLTELQAFHHQKATPKNVNVTNYIHSTMTLCTKIVIVVVPSLSENNLPRSDSRSKGDKFALRYGPGCTAPSSHIGFRIAECV